MDEERPFLEEVLDAVVYAPVGLALTALEDLPALIEKGRRRLAGQVGAARLVSRFALRSVRRRLDDLLAPTGTEATVTVLPTRAVTTAPEESAAEEIAAQRPTADELAIPGYDALAASQVIARLDALAPEELTAIERYELGGRKRRTIVNRIAQLRG